MWRENTLASVGFCLVSLCFWFPVQSIVAGQIQKGEMAGYLIVPNRQVDASFNAGFSMYVAAWPLVREYPGHRFQTGLFGTWMHAQYDSPPTEKLYSDIEGGLGLVARYPGSPPKRPSSSWAVWP